MIIISYMGKRRCRREGERKGCGEGGRERKRDGEGRWSKEKRIKGDKGGEKRMP